MILYTPPEQGSGIINHHILAQVKKQAASGSIPKWEAKQHQATCPGRHGAAPSTTTIRGTSMVRDWRKETKPLQGWGTLHHNLILKNLLNVICCCSMAVSPSPWFVVLNYQVTGVKLYQPAAVPPGHWPPHFSLISLLSTPAGSYLFVSTQGITKYN